MTTDAEALRRLVAGTLMPGFVGTELPAWITREYAGGLAAVCLYGANVAGPAQLSRLCAELRRAGPNLVIAVDEEGGDVTRLHYRTGSPQPGNAVLGRLDSTDLTRASAAAIGTELTAYGISLDLAPVVDVNSAADNPVIGVRSFGAEAALVARHSAAYVEGLQSVGVAACAKHFPGHGDTHADSHLELPRVDASLDVLESRELEPFRAAVAAGAACIMTSHIIVSSIDPDQPATFSAKVLGGLLRERLQFGGVVVSDALDMAGASGDCGIPEAAVRALVAGCDLLCTGSDTTQSGYAEVVDAVVAAVVGGRLGEGRVREAARRVARLASAYPGRGGGGGGRSGRAGGLEPATAPREPLVESAFEVGAAVAPWLEAHGPAMIVQVGSSSNLAVGHAAWGPASAGLTTDPEAVPTGARVAVVGRGLSAQHPVWQLAERFRAADHPTIVVECGWPRGGADLVTFGGSLSVSRALGRLLGVTAS